VHGPIVPLDARTEHHPLRSEAREHPPVQSETFGHKDRRFREFLPAGTEGNPARTPTVALAHTARLSDIPVHPVEVLQVPGGAARHPLRPGDRHVVAGVHPGGDAHRRASLQRRQRDRPDEQDRRGAGDAAQESPRPGQQDEEVLREAAQRRTVRVERRGRRVAHIIFVLSEQVRAEEGERREEVQAAGDETTARHPRRRHGGSRGQEGRRTGPFHRRISQVQGPDFAHA
jgi:hypothetical protein